MRWGWPLGLRGPFVGVVVGLSACGNASSPAGADEAAPPPAANAKAMLDEARRELTDPDRVPLRQGMKIDQEQLRQALVRLRQQHGTQVAEAYGAGIEGLPVGALPAAPRFVEVAAFALPDEPAAREVEALNWMFDADVHQTVQRVLGTYLTLMMHRDLEMAPMDIGIWMAFLRAAKPELRRCGGAEDAGRLLCLDYGSDVFVLDVAREEPAWVVTRLRWMQAAPLDP